MILKKFTVSLDGLLSHENIIFKLICSVSERTRNRTNVYVLSTSDETADIYINDIKNKSAQNPLTANQVNVWISDKNEGSDNTIPRPLIATRVLHTLDRLMENIEPVSNDRASENNSADNNSVNFSITEEEASELAIVHDEILENPANKTEPDTTSSVELTLVKNKINSSINKSGTQHVLVVDDSPSVRKQLEIELELFNVTIDFAESAGAAFALLKSNTYDLALLDVVLPDKNGFLICKYIKAERKDTVVIMLTGKATQADKIKGSLAGCNDYLIKPVGRVTFQNAVKNFIPIKNLNTAIEA